MKFPTIIKKTHFYLPTLSGWILLSGVFVTVTLLFLLNIHPFLAKSTPQGGDLLVVEGWLPDYALEKAAEVFSTGNYRLIISTGGPLDQGSYLIKFKTYAHLAQHSFNALGVEESLNMAVPAKSVRKDRTYQSALAFRDWFMHSEPNVQRIDLVSLGAHTHRSAMVFQRVLGSNVIVGKIPVENADYDYRKWWTSSEGVKTVLSEIVSGIYTFFFLSSK